MFFIFVFFLTASAQKCKNDFNAIISFTLNNENIIKQRYSHFTLKVFNSHFVKKKGSYIFI